LCISVLLYSTSSIFIQDITIDTQSIDFDVQQIATSAILTYSVTIGGANREDSVLILVELFDADGIVVVNGSNFQSQLIINKPHLCEPCGINHTHACTEQSYLYTLKVKLYNDESPRTILDVYRIEHVGIRTIRLTDSKFLVNERPFYFHGGNTNEDSDIRGRGFDQVILTKLFNLHGWFHGNAFRTIGMRNAEYFSDITLNHHKQTITEMIARDKNHPSVFIWSLANEPASSLPVAESYFSTLANFTRPIAAGRPIALVINDNLKTDLATPFYDIVCINRYFGWYTENGYIDQVTPLIFQELTNWHRKYPTKPILIIEYGAEVVPGLHNDPSLMFTEEYQKDFFAAYHLAFDNVSSLIHPDTGFFIGELVFTTFDFATEQNIKRVAGLNQKGIFTRQRQPKAGAYVINNRYEQLEQIQTVNKTI
jgi:beta-glucuronidase